MLAIKELCENQFSIEMGSLMIENEDSSVENDDFGVTRREACKPRRYHRRGRATDSVRPLQGLYRSAYSKGGNLDAELPGGYGFLHLKSCILHLKSCILYLKSWILH